jgi:hypothetical protein
MDIGASRAIRYAQFGTEVTLRTPAHRHDPGDGQ